MLECMKNRRSIRKYTDQDIPESLLNELLEVATRASNTGNMQLYSVVVTRDPANKEKLAPAHFNQPMITGAPVVLTFCADANRFVKWAECRKAEAGFDNLQTFIASTIDAMLFAQSFCNAAEEKGLGICYLGTTAYNADQIIEALSLPRLVVPIGYGGLSGRAYTRSSRTFTIGGCGTKRDLYGLYSGFHRCLV